MALVNKEEPCPRPFLWWLKEKGEEWTCPRCEKIWHIRNHPSALIGGRVLWPKHSPYSSYWAPYSMMICGAPGEAFNEELAGDPWNRNKKYPSFSMGDLDLSRSPLEENPEGFREANILEYRDWLRSYLKKGRKPTHFYDRPFSDMFVAVEDFSLSGAYGANSATIIVPKGVRYRGGEPGHCNVYLPRGETARGYFQRFVPLYNDAELLDLPGMAEFAEQKCREHAERQACAELVEMGYELQEAIDKMHTKSFWGLSVEAVRKRHNQVLDTLASYQIDQRFSDAPALADLTVSPTARFWRAMAHAQDLERNANKHPWRYAQAVSDVEKAWAQARAHAHRVGVANRCH